ncbi:MAG: hypothetical protein ABWY25_12580 [Paenisporosarcina sp.]
MDEITFGNGDAPVGENVSVSENGAEDEFSLANPFLNGMPEEHRTLLAPYVKKWDGQVTKKFQDYSSKLKPYEQLGPVDELRKYHAFANNFRNDPEGLFRLMWMGLRDQYGDKFQEELLRILELEEQEEQAMSDQYYQEDQAGNYAPDPTDVFQQNVAEELRSLREWKDNFEQSQQDAEGQAQLDNVLGQMHNAFGDFNDDFIVLELSKHGDIQQAMQAWNDLIGKYSSQQGPQRQAPKIMGGQGGVPTGQVDTSKLRDSDRRKAVENMLANLE